MAGLRRQLRTLQNDPNLGQFIMRDATPTGRQLGVGSYGSVEEIKVGGLVCAGKTIHEVLLEGENDGAEDIAQKYVRECQLMAGLRHPNVTLFLGLCILPAATLPVLVMERLESSLDDLLETAPNIPLALKRSILEDVARGLLYLHQRDPPIIHRDLTAKNVLLTSSFSAKITDLGNSRIVNLQPGQLARTMSRLPGTMTYMPPEAWSMASQYGPSLDIFSFGHLGLFTGLQVFPGDLLEHNYPDPDNPERLVARSEVERRGVYFEQLESSLLWRGGQHPFVRLVKQCLHNTPSQRPTTEVLLRTLEEMRAEIEGPYESLDVTKLGLMRQVAVNKTLKQSESELRRKDRETRRLQQELEQTQERHQNETEQLTTRLQERHRTEIEQLTTRLNQAQERHRTELAALTTRLNQAQERHRNEIVEVTTRLNQAQRESERVRQENEERLQELEMERAGLEETLRVLTTQAQRESERMRRENEERVSRLQDQLRQLEVSQDGLRADLRAKEADLQARVDQLRGKEADISRLQRELQKSQQRMETPLSQLKHPLRLKWRRGKDMPDGINQYPRVIAIDRKAYIGGGSARTVMVYDTHDDEIKTLPPLDYVFYGMTAHNSQLVVVGGQHHSTRKITNELSVLDHQRNVWTQPYPPMTIPSSWSSMISYDRFILVMGGQGEDGKYLSRVEVLDTSNRQWYQTTPLPEPCVDLTSCTIGSVVYLLGGWSKNVPTPNSCVYSASLHQLISNALSPSTGATPSPWTVLEGPPVKLFTALALQGSLLAVGGWGSSAIYAYQPSSKSWVKVGDLPRQQWKCGCTILPNGELLVAGGGYRDEKGRIVWDSRTVDIATITML